MLLLWILMAVFFCVCATNLPDITDRSFMDLCLQEHNRARSEVHPPATDMSFMSWDADLAVIAQSWARRCIFKHSPKSSRIKNPEFSSLGENLWVGSPPDFTVTHAIRGWVNETVDYSYNSNSCRERKMCGHYTQVVWAHSYKVGCAVHVCSSGIKETHFQSQPGANFVCNYGPAGNIFNQRPYQTSGDACSKCDPNVSCQDRLCRNKERDPEKGYGLGLAESSASNFVPVLIIRPVALFGSVIAAIAVKHFYPDVFCYE